MQRIIHKETGKALVISDSHANAMTLGRQAKYKVDPSFDPEAHAELKVKAEEARIKAERDKQFAEAEAEEAAAAKADEGNEEVPIEKEVKPAKAGKGKKS